MVGSRGIISHVPDFNHLSNCTAHTSSEIWFIRIRSIQIRKFLPFRLPYRGLAISMATKGLTCTPQGLTNTHSGSCTQEDQNDEFSYIGCRRWNLLTARLKWGFRINPQGREIKFMENTPEWLSGAGRLHQSFPPLPWTISQRGVGTLQSHGPLRLHLPVLLLWSKVSANLEVKYWAWSWSAAWPV